MLSLPSAFGLGVVFNLDFAQTLLRLPDGIPERSLVDLRLRRDREDHEYVSPHRLVKRPPTAASSTRPQLS